MVTKKQYDIIKKAVLKELEEKNICQCENKEFTEERHIYTTIIKYKEKFWEYCGLTDEYSFNTYLCPYCGKEYTDEVAIA